MKNKRYALFMLALMAVLCGFKLFLHVAKWRFISNTIPVLVLVSLLALLIRWLALIHKNSESPSKTTAVIGWSAAATVAAYVLFSVACNGLDQHVGGIFRFLSGDASLAALWITLLLAVIGWIVLICQNKQAKLWVFGLSLLTVLTLFVIGSIGFHVLLGVWNDREIARFDSPGGKHQVVVLDASFIDPLYKAYPVKLRYFCQDHENHDTAPLDGSRGTLHVTWENDTTAIVTVSSTYASPPDPAQEGRITVTFE